MENNYTGDKLKEMRLKKKMTQEELSEKSSINVRTIQRIENGEVSPRGSTLNLLANALDTPAKEFFDTKLKKDRTLIVLMCLSGLLYAIYPVLGIIAPIIIWTINRNTVKYMNTYGIVIICLQLVSIICYYAIKHDTLSDIASMGDVSPTLIAGAVKSQLKFVLTDTIIIFAVTLHALFYKRVSK